MGSGSSRRCPIRVRRSKARRSGGARPGRRHADPVLGIPRIERCGNAGMVRAERPLGHLQLAEDDGAGRAKARDDGRISVGDARSMDRHAGPGRHSGDVVQVLHGDRHAVQRASRFGRLRSRRRARPRPSSARSGMRVAYDLSVGSIFEIRSRIAWVSSTEEISRDAILCAASSSDQ